MNDIFRRQLQITRSAVAFLCVLIADPFLSFGQYKNMAFDHITVDEGLSQSTVFSIAQDTRGFIWIGTRDGLNRYDSHEFKIYRNSPDERTSLINNMVNALLLDSKGQLWVGTYQGLCLYRPESDNFTRITNVPGNTCSLSNNNINVIFEDRNKNIWVGTRNGLNLIVSQNPLKIVSYYHENDKSLLVDNYIRSIYEDESGEMWIGTMNGLSRIRFDKVTHRMMSGRQFTESNARSLSNNWINVITRGEGGKIWIGTEKGGLNIYDPKADVFYSRNNKGNDPFFQKLFSKIESVRVITKDSDGLYWVGTMSGLYILDPLRKNLREFSSNPDNSSSLSDNSVRAVFIDHDGSKWIGTYYGGINFYSATSKQFDHFRQVGTNSPLRFKIASALYEDFQNNLWLSIDGGGIIFWDRKKNTFSFYRHKQDDPASLSHDNVKCIYPDGHDGLWVGTFNGLNYFSFHTKKFTRYYHEKNNPNSIPNDRVYDIKADRNGDLWIATNGGGLCRFSKKEAKFRTIHFSGTNASTPNSDFLTCLTFDSKDRLWIGTSLGLNLQSSGGKFVRLPNLGSQNDSPEGKFILFVYEDRLKQIWIGTRGSGLFLFNEKKVSFSRFSTDNGLPGNNIFGILEDSKGFLWLSTENGISRFDTKNVRFKNYNKNDGLVCKEFNFNSYLKDHTGLMYFGGYNGIVTFHPDSITENVSIPPLAFTRLKLFNNEVKIGAKNGLLKQPVGETRLLTFRYDQNVFSIEFAVLNYINPNKNVYAYKLDGFEKDWNLVSKPVATYMNLKPGTYTFYAKGSNNEGDWNENPLSMTIKVLPPPWKTWWAFLLYVVVVVTALFYFMRMIRLRLKLEQNLYLEQLENKKQNELHQSKLRFFTNISHELRTPLTLIISPIENLVNATSDTGVRKQLQMIHSNANRLLRLLNQLLDFRKQETRNLKLKVAEGNMVKFIEEIRLAFQEFARLKHITLEFKRESENIRVWYDREELEKVFFNLLSNAFKFTAEGGNVLISLKEVISGNTSGPDFVEIVVEDNGIGIPKEHLKKVFDSFYQVENNNLVNQGFGIGLALSKGIIELHHGTITINSDEAVNGKPGGTTFTIRLKKGNAHFPEEEIIRNFKNSEQVDSYLLMEQELLETETLAPATKHSKEDRLILLVEDNPEIRNYLKSRLEQLYSVTEAGNGAEAWEIATETIPDLIVSDVMMPVMDGIALTSRLKSDERTSHIPVILVTARNTLVHQMEGLETGADDYITKPFHMGVLEVKIRNLLVSREKLRQKYGRIISLEPKHEELSDPDEKFIVRLLSIVENHMSDSEFNVSKLVLEIGMSRPVLFRKIKALTDMSVIDLIRTTRLKKAAMLLKQKKLTIAEVGYAVGFADAKYFSKAFRQQYGKSPSEYMEETSGPLRA